VILIYFASPKPGKTFSCAKLDDKTRVERTIEYVKTKGKEWTVGWPDFCGHTQAIGWGRT
jgi:hypothetical protein